MSDEKTITILKKDAKTKEVIEKICFVDGDDLEFEIGCCDQDLYELELRPSINPKFSCPSSVLNLESVVSGIEAGEIEVNIKRKTN